MSQNTFSISNLKPAQVKFLSWLYKSLYTSPYAVSSKSITQHYQTSFYREFLRKVAKENGMSWAPAWIIKDKKRSLKRGVYILPEFAEYCLQQDAEFLILDESPLHSNPNIGSPKSDSPEQK